MGNLFGAKKPEAAPMPDKDGPVAREAADRKQREIMTRSGRTATVMSGGDAVYSNSLLGQ